MPNEHQVLELYLLQSSENLNRWFSPKITTYAVVYIEGGVSPGRLLHAPVDKPSFDIPLSYQLLRFPIIYEPETLILRIVLRSTSGGVDRDIGEIRVPLVDLLHLTKMYTNPYYHYEFKLHNVGCPNVGDSCCTKGMLALSCNFVVSSELSEPIVGCFNRPPLQQDKKKKIHLRKLICDGAEIVGKIGALGMGLATWAFCIYNVGYMAGFLADVGDKVESGNLPSCWEIPDIFEKKQKKKRFLLFYKRC